MMDRYIPGVWYRVGDYRFSEGSLGDKRVFAFTLPDGTESSEFYDSIETAMSAAVGPRHTPAVRQSAEEFKAALDAYMELDMHDDDAKLTEEYGRYVHAAVVLASIVSAEIDIAAKAEGE